VNRCPITYEDCGEDTYSKRGLGLLNRKLTDLNTFPYSAQEQRREALIRAEKISIQGVHPKLSVVLSVKKAVFEIVDRGGRYILKPQHYEYPDMPENEALTMHMASIAGLDVPLNGLVTSADKTFTYFIRRFDRASKNRKLALEDFAQLSGRNRDTKYRYSMEKVVEILEKYCTFPAVEKVKLFQRSIFNFLVGNEDMHLKNFSIIHRDGKFELAPVYDYLSTTIVFQGIGRKLEEIEEIALPLRGKKNNLTAKDWIDYFGRERLDLPEKVSNKSLQIFETSVPKWHKLIDISYLGDLSKELYHELLKQRCAKLFRSRA